MFQLPNSKMDEFDFDEEGTTHESSSSSRHTTSSRKSHCKNSNNHDKDDLDINPQSDMSVSVSSSLSSIHSQEREELNGDSHHTFKSKQKRRRLNTFTSRVGRDTNTTSTQQHLGLNTIQEDDSLLDLSFSSTCNDNTKIKTDHNYDTPSNASYVLSSSKRSSSRKRRRIKSISSRNNELNNNNSNHNGDDESLSIISKANLTPQTPPTPQTPKTPQTPTIGILHNYSDSNNDISSTYSKSKLSIASASSVSSQYTPQSENSTRRKIVRFEDDKNNYYDNEDIEEESSQQMYLKDRYSSNEDHDNEMDDDGDGDEDNDNEMDDDDINNRVTGAGSDVFAVQDAGSFRLAQDDCIYLCSSFLSAIKGRNDNDFQDEDSSFKKNISTKHNSITADTICDLAAMLSSKKTRNDLMNIGNGVNNDFTQETYGSNNTTASTARLDNNDAIQNILEVLSCVPSSISGNILPTPFIILDPFHVKDNYDGSRFDRNSKSDDFTGYDRIVADGLALLANFLSYDCTLNTRYSASTSLTIARAFRKSLLQHKGAIKGIAR